ncbi:MAG: methylenetetrahydrofolate reductase [Nitrospirota bacterium]|nr:methylenetetrahydrofolate reductase [Nitrospirota bacterium]
MKNISIEIVPRTIEQFEKDIVTIRNNFPDINILNIPDLLRLDIRSWDVAKIAKKYFSTVIPHLRAIDFNLREPFKLISFFKQNNINSVLIITGDKPQDMSKKVYRNSCLELIRIFKKEAPDIKVYAGLDQYRQSFRKELDYIEDKRIAGADGFFTQPFFDIKLLEIYLDLLKDYEIFWGITPVLNETVKNYWESKNNVFFPSTFVPVMEWNVNFARKAVEIITAYKSNSYIMPIRVNIIEYLNEIFKNTKK